MIAWRRFSELEVWYYLIWNEKQTLYQLKGALEQKNTFWNDRQNYPTHKYVEMPNDWVIGKYQISVVIFLKGIFLGGQEGYPLTLTLTKVTPITYTDLQHVTYVLQLCDKKTALTHSILFQFYML